MAIFLVLLMSVVTAETAFLLGMLATLFIPSGPEVMLFVTCVGSVLVLLFCMWCRRMMEPYGTFQKVGSGVLVALTVVAFVVPPGSVWLGGHDQAVYLRANAPDVRDFGVAHFDAIDADHDGTLTEGEMSNALALDSWTPRERELLGLMRSQRDEFGHAIGSTQTLIIGSQTIGNVTIPTQTWVTTTIYGVNRDDLAGYPGEVQRRYQKW